MMLLRTFWTSLVLLAVVPPMLLTMPDSNAGESLVDQHLPAPARLATYRIAIPAALPSTATVYFGLWQPGFPESARLLGSVPGERKRPAIVSFFQAWDDLNNRPNLEAFRSIQAQGSVTMVTWEPWRPAGGDNQPEFRLTELAAGRYDEYVRSWAVQLARHPGPVLLRFAHEMNLTVYPWARRTDNSPELYRQVWRRYHKIFEQAGATNVRWVWSPGLTWNTENAIEPYFPGNDAVDWLATSGYNYPPWGGWQPFRVLFGPTLARLGAISDRPIMIAEVGSVEEGGNKAEWIRSAFQNEVFLFPRLRAVVWFNERDPNTGADWRIESSEPARRAFDQAVATPGYLSRWAE